MIRRQSAVGSRQWFLAVLASVIALPLAAQTEPPPRLPLGDTLLTLPSANIAPPGTWEVKFTHRFNQPVDEGSFADQAHSLFGLDSSADVVFGASKSITTDLQFSLVRSNTNDTLEAAAKYVLLRQGEAMPLTATLRGGLDWRTERNMEDRYSLFAQAIVSRQIGAKAEVFLLPTFVTNAGRAVSGDASVALFEHAFNVPAGFAVLIRPQLSLVVEFTPPNRDLPDGVQSDPAWAVGIKRALRGHWFEILLTNSQAGTADQYVTTTYQGTPLDGGSMHLGFNIERRFGRRR